MSCLTRSMQKNLSRYIKSRVDHSGRRNHEELRKLLISRGVCPSSITADQVKVIVEGIH